MLPSHSAILATFIKLPFVIKIFVLSIFSGHLKQVLLLCEQSMKYSMSAQGLF